MSKCFEIACIFITTQTNRKKQKFCFTNNVIMKYEAIAGNCIKLEALNREWELKYIINHRIMKRQHSGHAKVMLLLRRSFMLLKINSLTQN